MSYRIPPFNIHNQSYLTHGMWKEYRNWENDNKRWKETDVWYDEKPNKVYKYIHANYKPKPYYMYPDPDNPGFEIMSDFPRPKVLSKRVFKKVPKRTAEMKGKWTAGYI